MFILHLLSIIFGVFLIFFLVEWIYERESQQYFTVFSADVYSKKYKTGVNIIGFVLWLSILGFWIGSFYEYECCDPGAIAYFIVCGLFIVAVFIAVITIKNVIPEGSNENNGSNYNNDTTGATGTPPVVPRELRFAVV